VEIDDGAERLLATKRVMETRMNAAAAQGAARLYRPAPIGEKVNPERE
jgi:hypothetical protein